MFKYKVRKLLNKKINRHDLRNFEFKVYSQNGEDGIIEEIFNRIGNRTKYAVEFGVEDGRECNTRFLKEKKGWKVIQFDGVECKGSDIKKEFITAKNINKIFAKYKIPYDLDLLSIDIDSNDLWVWKSLSADYRPRLIIIEYNATIAPNYSQSVAHDDKLNWDGTNYFGASLLAFFRLARTRGYSLVACDSRGVNAFFVRDDLLGDKTRLYPKTPSEAYSPPDFGYVDKFGAKTAHKPTKRKFINIKESFFD